MTLPACPGPLGHPPPPHQLACASPPPLPLPPIFPSRARAARCRITHRLDEPDHVLVREAPAARLTHLPPKPPRTFTLPAPRTGARKIGSKTPR
eukprot:COSAG01_NODE_3811_length_5675_cov_6.241930_2_plen_94_part_00